MSTRRIVPRGDGEGGLGTALKRWGPIYTTEIHANNISMTIPDASESEKGLVQLASAVEVNAGTDAEKAVVPATLHQRQATEAIRGLIELATSAEVVAGTDTQRAVTPAGLQAARAFASTGQAEEGTLENVVMSPATTLASIAANASKTSFATETQATIGTATDVVMSPATTLASIATNAPKTSFASESEVLAGEVMDKAIAPDTLEAKVGETITAVNYLRTIPLLTDPVIGIALVATGGGAGTWQRVDEDGNNLIVGSTFAFGGIYYNHHPIYSALGEEIIDGQRMIRIPAVYVKTGAAPVGSDQAGKTCYWISPEPKDGYHLHPAFYHYGAAVDQFWWGAYKAGVSDGKLTSLPGTSCRVGAPQATFEAEAEARNVGGVAGFMLTSYHQLCVIQRLALIEMGTPDSQLVIAQGHVSGSEQVATSDPLEMAASWRGLNGLWGNVAQLMVGWQNTAANKLEIWDRLGNRTFVDTGVNPNLIGAMRYATTLRTDSGTGYDHSDGFLPSAADATVGNGTLADVYYGPPVPASYHHGGPWPWGPKCGLFTVEASDSPSFSPERYGCRLARVI